MSQLLLVEIRDFQCGSDGHVGIPPVVDIRLDRSQVLIGLRESRIGLGSEIVCHIIFCAGNSNHPCNQQKETFFKCIVHDEIYYLTILYGLTYLGVKNTLLLDSRVWTTSVSVVETLMLLSAKVTS